MMSRGESITPVAALSDARRVNVIPHAVHTGDTIHFGGHLGSEVKFAAIQYWTMKATIS